MGRKTQRGEAPDMRTLDDPAPAHDFRHAAASDFILPGEVLADALRAGDGVLVAAAGRPNAWRRFWLRLLLGWRWEKR